MRRHFVLFAIAGLLAGTAIASDSVNLSGSEGSARLDYVGDDWRIGLGLSDEGDVVAELLGVLALGERNSWVAEGWLQDGAGGVKLNYHWLPGTGDPAQQDELPGVYKLYLAADQNRHDDRKLSLGAGYEKQNLFWSTQLSFGLTDERLVDDVTDVSEQYVFGTDSSGRPFRRLQTTTVLTETFEQAYDYGAGVRVGRYFNQPNVRLQGGVDYEWGDFDSDQITLSGTAEKFFTGTGHSLALSVERFEKSGDFEQEDADTRATLIWRYAFGRTYRPRMPADAMAAPAPAETATQDDRPEETTTRIVRSNVEMESDAFFAFDSAEIRPDAREELQQVADLITRGEIVGRVSVVGHTCDIGPERYNQGLSDRRADAVKRELVALGLDPDAIVTDGRGESEPLVPNTSEENRKLNRRVDVEFIRVVEEEEVVRIPPDPEPKAEPVAVREEPVREAPAWVMRALRNPAQHKRSVDVYRFERSTTTVTHGEREFLNRAPVAEDDTATAARNGDEVFVDVLANDADPDGDALTVVSIDPPASGSVVNNGDFVTYTPADGFQGEDRFAYTVSDGEDSASATVTVTVTNDAPVTQADSAETSSGEPVVIDVLANDSDPNGDALELTAASAAGNGTTSLAGDRVRYVPNDGFTGTDSFTYTVRDAAGAEATGEVTVSVRNEAPIAQPDTAETDSGAPVVIDVLANDSDPNGDVLELTAVSAAGNGTTSIVGDRVRYLPNDGFAGTDSFVYTVRDSVGAEATAEVTVTVDNRPPVAVADSAEVNVGQSVDIDVLANDSDPEGDPITLVSVGEPSIGTAAVVGRQVRYTATAFGSGTDTFTYEIEAEGGRATGTVTVRLGAPPPTAADDSASTVEGRPVRVEVLANDVAGTGQALTISEVEDAPNGTTRIEGDAVVYTPDSGFVGTDRFEYTVREGNGATASATVTIAVESANTPPVATFDQLITDTTSIVTIDVLANDFDVDGDPLVIVELLDLPSTSIAIITVTEDNRIRFEPTGWTGSQPIRIRYRISDLRGGTATATLEIES